MFRKRYRHSCPLILGLACAATLSACWSWSFSPDVLDGGDNGPDAQGVVEPPACKKGTSCGNGNGLCVADGECAAGGQFLYVGAAGACSSGGMGTSPANARCLPDALASDHPYLFLLNGIYTGPITITKPHQLFAESPKATLETNCGELVIMSKATLAGFTIMGNVSVVGQATLLANHIGPSSCIAGVHCGAASTSLEMRGNFVHDHATLGIRVEAGNFDLSNNIIVRNGSKSSVFGGVWLKAASISKFFNNTVSNNESRKQDRDGSVAGIFCEGAVSIQNSILWQNVGGTDDLGGGCQNLNSLIGADPMFQAADPSAPGDYRPKPGSKAINPDVFSPDGPSHDYFNVPRGDGRPDLGAVEYLAVPARN